MTPEPEDEETTKPQSEPLKDTGDPLEEHEPEQKPEPEEPVQKLLEDGRARGF